MTPVILSQANQFITQFMLIVHKLLTPTEILSYLAAADVFLLGWFANNLHQEAKNMASRFSDQFSFISKDDEMSPVVVCWISCLLAGDITIFYNYTLVETLMNNAFVIIICILTTYFHQKLNDDEKGSTSLRKEKSKK